MADGWGKSRILGFVCWQTKLTSSSFLCKLRNIFLPYKTFVIYINWAQVEVVWDSVIRLNIILDGLQRITETGSSQLRAMEGSHPGLRPAWKLWWRSYKQQTVCGDPRKFFRIWQRVMRLRAKLDFSPRRWKKSKSSVSRTGEWTRSDIPRVKAGTHLLELGSETVNQAWHWLGVKPETLTLALVSAWACNTRPAWN